MGLAHIGRDKARSTAATITVFFTDFPSTAHKLPLNGGMTKVIRLETRVNMRFFITVASSCNPRKSLPQLTYEVSELGRVRFLEVSFRAGKLLPALFRSNAPGTHRTVKPLRAA